VFGGAASVQRGAKGFEGGASIDLGHLHSTRVRLGGEVSFLHVTLREYVPQEDTTYSGPVVDLSGTVALTWFGGSDRSRVAPYVQVGAAVHALSSSFGSLVLDPRYNANRLGLTGAAGVNWWLGQSGRRSLFVEARRTYALNVNRWMVRAGAWVHFAPLARPR
jgi:hypothetical protein